MKEMRNRNTILLACLILLAAPALGLSQEFQLLTGLNPGNAPGTPRTVEPSTPLGSPFPPGFGGTFLDGDRLARTTGGTPDPWQGNGTPLFSPNQFGSLSFMFRRGSVPLGPGQQLPILGIDYLGGPLLDLDGDLNNGSRSLVPVTGQSAVPIPGSHSSLSLSFDKPNNTVALGAVDATGTNSGASGLDPRFGVTVNTLAGTQSDGSQTGSINPSVDTRQGTLVPFASGVTQITDLGYEIWQDSLGPSSTASTLGTLQNLGSTRGWLIERDTNGNFPALAGLGLGSTLWPLVDAAGVGLTLNSANNPGTPLFTVTDGLPNDIFSAPGNGGLALTEFSGDLGAYLDSVVVPLIDPLSESFVYLESAGFGNSNSADPVFGSTNGYDVVLLAQSAPVPEPASGLFVLVSALWFLGRPRNRRGGA
jgi:hypothetical protein